MATASIPSPLSFKPRHWVELHERAPSIHVAKVGRPVLGVRENRLEGWEVQGEQPGSLLWRGALMALRLCLYPTILTV